ncbi:6-phosphogluconolactonase [Oceanococcus atlanticus]|uniref:6-phosphogluconolactonase n=1 Tax=Oceanococcus atlanticus TaxID=1317117 RepID=A0A1Y1SD24_9GAMM|nr:6-phosphogluconolactonase [Oceanococcus atlanticus]ORE86908.1 6-phosphogluconolactonase [Oceanococcus atlanticus]
MRAEDLDWHRFADSHKLADALASQIASDLNQALGERGSASLAVSGGSTPLALFNALSSIDLDWSRVTVLPVDERWVDEDDAQSNSRLIRQQLLRECATAARFISLKHPTSQPQAAQEACNARLATLEQPLDVVVLGMGLDGHTASLFPDAPELADALASTRCCHALSPASQPTARMSLTPALLNAARRRVLHIEGEDKRQVLDAVLADPQALRYPIAMALTAEAAAPLQIYWAA